MRLVVVSALLLQLSASSVTAQDRDIHAIMEDVSTQIDQGAFGMAMTTLREAMMQLSERAPLAIAKAELVIDEAQAYGSYAIRQSNIFRSGEPILIYMEPQGYAFARGDDILEFRVEADFYLLDTNGSVLAGQEHFGRWAVRTRQPVFEFFMNLTYSLDGVPSGRYVIRTVIHDMVDQELASIETPIEIR